MNWFANVGKYLWSRETTPYFTAPEALTRSQARHETFAYAVLLGSVFAVLGIGGAIASARSPALSPILWTLCSALVLWACFDLPRFRDRSAAWVVALAPSLVLLQILLTGLGPGGFGPDELLMLLFIALLLRYGWRVVRIARCQLTRPPEGGDPVSKDR